VNGLANGEADKREESADDEETPAPGRNGSSAVKKKKKKPKKKSSGGAVKQTSPPLSLYPNFIPPEHILLEKSGNTPMSTCSCHGKWEC
jgi:hypothetical protein